MKQTFVTCALAIIATVAQSQPTCTEMQTTAKPITCKLTTPELQKRKATVIADLKARVLERYELTDGYAYKFEGSDHNLDKLIEFIKSERMCCDFFTFTLVIEENVVTLRIAGPDGAKSFLKEEVDL